MNPVQEPKYDVNEEGNLFNRASGEEIPEDEPVFILRARDVLAHQAIDYYHRISSYSMEERQLSLAEQEQRRAIKIRLDQFRRFAKDNPDRMKKPDTQLGLPFMEIGETNND